MRVVLRHVDVEPAVGDDVAFAERIFVRMAHRDEDVVALAVGEVEPGDPAHDLARGVAPPFQRLGKLGELALLRHAVEAADAHVDRMDLASADEVHDVVAGLLHLQPALDRVAVVARHVDEPS